jgi:hypothetical protein
LAIPDTYTGPLAQLCVRPANKRLTITCDHQELVILVDVVYLDVRERGDYLLLGRKVGALLELEVTYRTREGKVAIDAAKIDETTSCLDARFLGWQLLAGYSHGEAERPTFVLRLVVEREGLRSAFYAQDGPRIASVGLLESVYAWNVAGPMVHTQ